jgi:transcriptional regulator with XRE-family HTH domain
VIVKITNVFAFTRSITFVKTIGQRIRHARQLRQLTQAQLARACGLSQGAIGNYESDSRRSPKNILRIADALRVEPAWLAMGTGPMETVGMQVGEATAIAQAGDWPFPSVSRARILALSPAQRQLVDSTVLALVDALEASNITP